MANPPPAPSETTMLRMTTALLLVELKLQARMYNGIEVLEKIAPPETEKLRDDTKYSPMTEKLEKLLRDTTIGDCEKENDEVKDRAPPETVTDALSSEEHDKRAKHSSNEESSIKRSRVVLKTMTLGDISNDTAPPLAEEYMERQDCMKSQVEQRENVLAVM